MNNKVVGVAFETNLGSQNIGYCIPIRVVMHFLNDIEKHGIYTNFPKLGFRWQKIENPSLKKYLKMVDDDYNPNQSESDDDEDDENEDPEQEMKDNVSKEKKEKKKKMKPMNGILINSVYPLTDCNNKLKENDVLLEIEGTEIGEDGTIKYPFPSDGVSRINYTYITSNKFCEDMVNLKILRDGKIMNIQVMVDVIDYLVPIVLYDRPVTYYIFGGFVFLPLSRPYLRSEYGSKWSSKCAVKLKDLYFNGYKEEKDEEVVILSRVLASDINVGFHKFTNCVLEKVNGVKVKNIKQLINEIETCIKNKTSKFIHFLFEQNVSMVLEINIAIDGMKKIMDEHKIKYDRSPNLRQGGNGKNGKIPSNKLLVKKSKAIKRNKKNNDNVVASNKNGIGLNNKAMILIDEITEIFEENEDY